MAQYRRWPTNHEILALMAPDNVETVRELYAVIMGPGRLEDPGTTELIPRFFDPEIHVRQTSDLIGTAGEFHGYRGMLKASLEFVQVFAELIMVPLEIEAAGDLVATAVSVRGTGRSSGVPFEGQIGHLFTLRDGLVIRWEVFKEPRDAFRAAGLA